MGGGRPETFNINRVLRGRVHCQLVARMVPAGAALVLCSAKVFAHVLQSDYGVHLVVLLLPHCPSPPPYGW